MIRLEIAHYRMRRITPYIVLAFAAFFFLAGLAFIPLAGLQNDEVIFGAAIYQPLEVEFSKSVFHANVPLMLMSYLGTLKSWLYVPVFKIWPPSSASVRIPVLLAGAALIWFLFLLLRRVHSDRAAVISCALLATDPIFLLTTCADWGPSILLQVLLLGGLLLLLKFHRSQSGSVLTAAFFLFGLGLWEKALFIWFLAGIGVAALAAFPRELVRLLTMRRLAVAAAALCLGALPLVLYNVSSQLKTFRANTAYSTRDLPQKIDLLRMSFDGRALFGWFASDDPGKHPGVPASTFEHASNRLSQLFHQPRTNQMGRAFVLSLLLVPVVWLAQTRTASTATRPWFRIVFFALIFMVVVWAQMAFNQGTGGGVHHVILLWPFHHLFIGIVLAEAAFALRRLGTVAFAVVVTIVLLSNVAVANEYYIQLVRNGGALNFTDAVYPLSDYMGTIRAEQVFVIDWGMLNTLRLLHRGHLPLRHGAIAARDAESVTPADRKFVEYMVSNSGNVFVGHTEGNEFVAGASALLRAVAQQAGYRKELMMVISDRNQRPMFEVFRFSKN